MSKTLKLFTLALVFAFILTACGSSKPTPDADGVVGSYKVAGTNPDGAKYEGTLDVTAADKAFKWNWDSGKFAGAALQQGNVVSAARGGDACYLVSYVIKENGVLDGVWSDMALSGLGTDVDTPTDNKPAGLEGLYNVAGKNPDGSEYGCSLQVTKKGDVYEWYWFSCGEYTGVAIQNGNVITVAYGAESCSAFSYSLQDDGTLQGTWATVGGTTVGTEIATPK